MPKSSKQRSKEYRERNPGRDKAKGIKYRGKLREDILLHYGDDKLACVKCGFSDIRALTLDHITATGKLNKERNSLMLYSRLRRTGYPEGYQTLCMNCQFIKRHENSECARPFWRFPPKDCI